MAHKIDVATPLADTYAEALLLAAAEQGQDEAVAEELTELVRLMDEKPEFDAYLTSATVDDEPRREVLEKLRGRMSDLLLNLLHVLNNRGRCGLIRRVRRAVQLRMEAKHQQQEVHVETAMPLADDLKTAISAEIRRRIGKEALLIEEHSPELIGGVVIHVGDMQIDASVASRLRLMRKRWAERATDEIQGGRGYAVEV